MSDKLKNLTGKNPRDFEPVVFTLINKPDVDLFKELVDSEDFLFDFVKQNVCNRMASVCNESNYLNLLQFLKFYSPSYEDFIVSTLVNFADEDLTDRMLGIFEDGTEDEKAYCAKFFSYIQEPVAIDFLKENVYSQHHGLSSNCAAALAAIGNKDCYFEALEKLNSVDDFEKLDAVKFLVSYGDTGAVLNILNAVKSSAMAENIAGELLYLTDIFSILERSESDGLFILNLIINGLGEIFDLSQVFDFRLYDVLEFILNTTMTSQRAVVLLNAVDKFDALTENDEYLFDNSKDVKQEVFGIKKLLKSADREVLNSFMSNELKQDSLLVYTALDLTSDVSGVRLLLGANNQTIVLKAVETLKRLKAFSDNDRTFALNVVSDENIKNIINAM